MSTWKIPGFEHLVQNSLSSLSRISVLNFINSNYDFFFKTIIIITGPIHRENIYKKLSSRCIILYISFLSIRNIYINLTTGSSANFRYMSVQFGGTESNEPHSQNLPLCVNTFLCDLLFREWRNVYQFSFRESPPFPLIPYTQSNILCMSTTQGYHLQCTILHRTAGIPGPFTGPERVQ